MEHGLTSDSSSSSDGSSDFQSNHPMSVETAFPTPPRPFGFGGSSDGNRLPFNQPQQNFGSYHLPASNLPQDFRPGSSSGELFPQMQLYNSQLPWSTVQPRNEVTVHDSLTGFGSQEVPFQSMAEPSDNLYPNEVVPYQYHPMNSPVQQDQTMNWNEGTSQDLSTYAAPPADSKYIRNSLYDPMYQMMGLPVDPHLRMFLAQQNNGNND